MDNLYLVISYLFVGAAAGFIGGLLGVGGGVIVVPALIFIFEFTGLFTGPSLPQNSLVLFAVGTSMASIVFTTGSSAYAQFRRKNIDWTTVRSWLPFLVLGAFTAGFIAKYLPLIVLKSMIAIFLLFVACVLLFNQLPTSQKTAPKRGSTAAIASVGGLISGLVGIGGGNIVVPTLLYFNTAIVKATAIASTCGVGIALFGTAGYILNGLDLEHSYTLGYIYLPALIPIAITNTMFAPIGVHYAHQIPAPKLKKIFGAVMALVSLRMLYGVVVG